MKIPENIRAAYQLAQQGDTQAEDVLHRMLDALPYDLSMEDIAISLSTQETPTSTYSNEMFAAIRSTMSRPGMRDNVFNSLPDSVRSLNRRAASAAAISDIDTDATHDDIVNSIRGLAESQVTIIEALQRLLALQISDIVPDPETIPLESGQ